MTRKPRYWLSRSVIASWALHIPLVAWLEPESIAARVLASHPVGMLCLCILAGCALVALADVLCNDLPVLNWFLGGMNHRHIAFMGMASMLVLLSGVLLKQIGWTALLLAYWLPVFFSVLIVPLDMESRFRGRTE